MVVSREVWGCVVVSREVWGCVMGHQQTRETPNKKNTNKQGKRLSNKGNAFRARETPNKRNTFQARKRLSSKGYLPIKCKSLQVVGVSRQGKAVVSDGGYGVIGG